MIWSCTGNVELQLEEKCQRVYKIATAFQNREKNFVIWEENSWESGWLTKSFSGKRF